MKHSQLLYSLSFLLISFISFGQEKPPLDFVKTEHDFGEIKEEDGPAIYEFSFVNNSETPIIISGVKASCGCTTPGWSREPVLPGEKGFIKAQYNPRNRPGSFRKTLTVSTNAASVGRLYLYIKGKVIPRVKTIEERLPVLMGDLRFKSNSIQLSKMTTEKPIERMYEIYNEGVDTIRILDKYEAPDFIKLTFSDAVMAPKGTSQMTIWYDPDHKDNLGINDHGISFFTDEKEDAQKNLSVRATISEYFEPLTEADKAKAPLLQIAERMKDMGNVPALTKKTETFELKNAGQSKLTIKKVESNCICLAAEVADENVKPGESTILTVTFDAQNRRGRQTKSVTIYSNDPNDPTQMVTVKTMVVSKN